MLRFLSDMSASWSGELPNCLVPSDPFYSTRITGEKSEDDRIGGLIGSIYRQTTTTDPPAPTTTHSREVISDYEEEDLSTAVQTLMDLQDEAQSGDRGQKSKPRPREKYRPLLAGMFARVIADEGHACKTISTEDCGGIWWSRRAEETSYPATRANLKEGLAHTTSSTIHAVHMLDLSQCGLNSLGPLSRLLTPDNCEECGKTYKGLIESVKYGKFLCGTCNENIRFARLPDDDPRVSASCGWCGKLPGRTRSTAHKYYCHGCLKISPRDKRTDIP
jgi:hypothetical protein